MTPLSICPLVSMDLLFWLHVACSVCYQHPAEKRYAQKSDSPTRRRQQAAFINQHPSHTLDVCIECRLTNFTPSYAHSRKCSLLCSFLHFLKKCSNRTYCIYLHEDALKRFPWILVVFLCECLMMHSGCWIYYNHDTFRRKSTEHATENLFGRTLLTTFFTTNWFHLFHFLIFAKF